MPRRVEVRHPGYPIPNIIFSIPANDGPNRDRAHYPTIVATGAVFTETQSGLWLSKGPSDEPPVDPDANDLIPAGEYFLHVTRGYAPDIGPYPITANFRAWTFPTQVSLPLWYQIIETMSNSQSTMAPELLVNEPCRITNNRLACENAHIIPSSEKAWFLRNEMDRYGRLGGRSGEAVADSASNLVRLTRDAHWLWDTFHITVVPRANPEGGGAVEWFTQMLVEDEELYTRWHHRKLPSLDGRAPQYLFARFAWDIFPKLHTFLQAGQPRRLSVRQPDGTIDVHMYSANECWNFALGQGRGRSASPTKRARSDVGSLNDDLLYSKDRTPCSNANSFDSAVADMGNGSGIEHWRERIDSGDGRFEASVNRTSPQYRESDRGEHEEDRGRKRRKAIGS